MSVPDVIATVVVQVMLVFAILFALIGARTMGKDTALGARAGQISDCFRNQFELPVLFFALVPLALLTHKADLAFVVLAWLFVISRLVHALIHTTINRIPSAARPSGRAPCFSASPGSGSRSISPRARDGAGRRSPGTSPFLHRG